jgi:hypothetical protein
VARPPALDPAAAARPPRRYYEPYSTPTGPPPTRPVDDLLEQVGLVEHADQRIVTLSGGQRRRLDVAIGIIGRPELLFLDEPTAGFDPHARREFHELVPRPRRHEDTTILLTTHDLGEAEKLADRILILAAGRIVADGTADELARQVAGRLEVRWARDGQRFMHETDDATGFVRELLAEHDDVSDLEVRRRASRTPTSRWSTSTRPGADPRRSTVHPTRDGRGTDERARPTRSGSGCTAAGPSSSRACAAPRTRASTCSWAWACSATCSSAATPRSRAPGCSSRRCRCRASSGMLIAFSVVIGPAYHARDGARGRHAAAGQGRPARHRRAT